MAMSMAGNGSGRGSRRSRRKRSEPMSEINVTPMVDVMLVLLIVFMVAAPLLTVGVPIDLPQTQAQSLETPSSPITLTITSEGAVFIGEDAVALDEVVTQLGTLVEDPGAQRIFLRGDAQANYGAVMRVMGTLSGAGYSQIGLITDQEQGQ
ncbi:MAG TPA: biopolymer transporter ExbD [Devosia sp.]|nr:biopolymer transporter ExbD [Devosia sp.]